MHVSTCTNETNFDTALTVYEGDCSSLKCVDGRDDDLECGTDEHSTVSWQATGGQQYYILIHGSEQNHTGDFGFVVTESEPLQQDKSAAADLKRRWLPLSMVSFGIWWLGQL